jgi:hypothetical protein
MKLALLNTLSDGRGGGLNPDGLSLDLQFAADKTLTARRGPTPVFTRGSTGTFVGSNGLIQSAAIDAPRFDHDPVTLACRGLLIEEGRTNAFQHSEIFNEAASSNYWDSVTANAVTSNQTTSPDGAATADLLTTSTASFDCFVRRAINWVGSTQYSYSIFLKRGPSNHRYVGLYIGAGITGAVQYPYFDFDNPTTVQIPSGTMVGTINSTRVDAYPNGWYRVSVTFTTAATPVTIYGGVYVSTSNGTLSSIPTAGLDCYIWGIQAETGSFPTSYIPTTTAPLARSADVCSITGANFTGIYNAIEGTFLSNSSQPFITVANALVYAADNGSDSGRFNLRHQTSFTVSQLGGVTQSIIDLSDPTANAVSKIAYAYANANYGAARNGTLGAGAPNLAVPTVNRIFIGSKGHNSSEYLNGHIASLRYYKKRLPDAKIQALTA